jgi:hypothetical protein
MAVVERKRGDDIPLLIGLSDSLGNAINIATLAELYIYVIHGRTGAILVKFSKAGTGGFTALTQITPTSYQAIILSGVTKNATIGGYCIDINVVETDINYQSSQKNTIGIMSIFNLKDSVSKVVSSG